MGSGRDSPLFDEFSDGEEFELPGRKRRHSKSKVKGQPKLFVCMSKASS